MHGKEAIGMIFANSQMEFVHHTLDARRREASTERLLRERPRRTANARHVLATALRRIADAVEPPAIHRHHPHLPS